MPHHGTAVTIDEDERRRFLKTLGLAGTAVAVGELSIDQLRDETVAGDTEKLAGMGEAVRTDLSGSLDAEVLAAGTAGLADGFERLPELSAMGFLERDTNPYTDLVEPGREVYAHLAELGFFESIEQHLPGFTADHIEDTARELIRAEPLTAALSAVGFTDKEIAAVVSSIVNDVEHLALWVPTVDIPAGVEFDVEAVPPVYQRAAGGALLWIEDLDTHLWQKQYILTEELLDQGLWDVKVMLGGLYLMSKAAADIAGPRELTEEQLTAALTGGSAAMIVGQRDIANDLFRVTEDMRAPAPRNGGGPT